MHGILPIIFLFVFLVLLLLGSLALGILKIIRGKEGASQEVLGEEAEQMQTLHRDLARMAERIEALETILLEREPGERTHGQD